jgi:hypothetical protein
MAPNIICRRGTMVGPRHGSAVGASANVKEPGQHVKDALKNALH